MTEEWRKIYDGIYEVSNMGRVRRVLKSRGTRPGKELKTADNGRGYRFLQLSVNGKYVRMYLHVLVARTFIGRPPRGRSTVNHKDGDKSNCRVSNLEWSSYAENNRHAIRTGLKKRIFSKDQVREMRKLYETESISSIAKMFGSSNFGLVSHIVKGKLYTDVGAKA